MKKILMTSIFIGLSLNAMAYEFKPYLGLYTGYNSLSGKDSNEANKDGFNVGAFGTASFLTESFVFDTSLGYQYNSMTGDKALGVGQSTVKVRTQTLFIDLDPRYRFDQRWSLGPTLSLHFNNKGVDNSLSEEEKKMGSKFVNVLAGAKVAYDTKWGDNDIRLFASAMTNLNDRERTNLVANVGIMISFDGWGYKTSPKPAVQREYRTYAQPQVKKVVKEIPRQEVADVKVTLKFARVGFATNAYQLDKNGTDRISKLGKALSKNPTLFNRVKISGHTDYRGGKEYNQKLSQDRADSVVKVLTESGVAETKMQAVGYGLSRPLDNGYSEESLEKNRRTEIEFFGVSDRAKLNKILEESLK